MTELYSNLSTAEIEHLYADDNPALKQYIATKEKEYEEAGMMNEYQVEEHVSEHLGEFLYNLSPFLSGDLPEGVLHFTHYWDECITPTINHLGGVLFDSSTYKSDHQELLNAILSWNRVCVSGSEIMYYEKDVDHIYCSELTVSTYYVGGHIPVAMLGYWDNEDGELVLNKELNAIVDY